MSSQIGRFLGLGLKNWCFPFCFDLPLIGLKLGVDVLKISSQHSEKPTCKVSSQFELFWSSFDLFFLGSCCYFWIVRSLREKRGTSGNLQTIESLEENTEPPHLYAEKLCLGSLSARFEIRLLHWSSSVSRIFFRYSCYQLAWVFWVENSLPLHRSWVSLFCPSV
jgi:hypothetical protein